MSDNKIIANLNPEITPEADLLAPSFTPQIEGEQSANHPAKTAKFTDMNELKKITLEELKFQNFDPTLKEKYIKTHPESEQLEYYKKVCNYLKEEIAKGSKSWSEMFQDNLKCGQNIEELKALNEGLQAELQKLETVHQELKKNYEEITQKRTIKRRIKQAAHNYLRDKELHEQKQTNKVYKKELQKNQQSPVTDVMLSKMINLRNSGKKYTEIATALNVSTATVSKHLKRNTDKLTEFQNR